MYEYKFVNIQNADPAKEIVARNLSSAIFNSAPVTFIRVKCSTKIKRALKLLGLSSSALW